MFADWVLFIFSGLCFALTLFIPETLVPAQMFFQSSMTETWFPPGSIGRSPLARFFSSRPPISRMGEFIVRAPRCLLYISATQYVPATKTRTRTASTQPQAPERARTPTQCDNDSESANTHTHHASTTMTTMLATISNYPHDNGHTHRDDGSHLNCTPPDYEHRVEVICALRTITRGMLMAACTLKSDECVTKCTHALKLLMMESAVVMQKTVVDLGGLKPHISDLPKVCKCNDSVWIVINSKVYNVSKFHPEGAAVLGIAGKDITETFFGLHRHEVLLRPQYAPTDWCHCGRGRDGQAASTWRALQCTVRRTTWLSDSFKTPYYTDNHRAFHKAFCTFMQEVAEAERCEANGKRFFAGAR
ncbi:hypothetical protein BDZ89DRAFT_1046587 [Hymenopellis radicata]|nr:hypothetical protein BDZ89DRAFT_1046587 [Hymenopellis radicata]